MRFAALALFLLPTVGLWRAAEPSPSAATENWPVWRGPRLDGTTTARGVPTRWTASENVRWKTAIPGIGHSSPIIWGDRLFVTACEEEKGDRLLMCLDRADGKVLWSKVVLTAKLERKHRLNSFASATPATDGKLVWVTFLSDHDVLVFAYDFDGNQVWRHSPGKHFSVHGFCSSPVPHKDTVIVNVDQDAAGYLVALDKATGAEKWRVARPNKTRSYCVPVLVRSAKRPNVTQLVLSGSRCVTGYDADTGKLLWIIDGPTEQYVASLVFHDELLFLTTGYPEYHIMAIRPDGSGNITKSEHIAWHRGHAENLARGAAYVPSPVATKGLLYIVSDAGFLNCFDASTGKRLYQERLGRRHSASPVLIDGLLYLPDDDGNTFVVKASDRFELVSKNPLGEEVYASPAAVGGQLFLRGDKHLYCIERTSGL